MTWLPVTSMVPALSTVHLKKCSQRRKAPRLRLFLVCGFSVVCSCLDPGDLCLSFCVVVALFTFEVSGQEMGSDGSQTKKCKSWIPGLLRAEKVLAGAIAIDGQ